MSSRFLKPALAGFEPYVPGLQPADGEDWVKLNTNEAPWPPSAAVLDAIRAAVGDDLRLYPDPRARKAREAVARHTGLDPEWVAVGNGGDELLELVFRAFIGAGGTVAINDPTYPLLAILGRVHESKVTLHPLASDFSLSPGYESDSAQVKILVNPNSPTGTWLDRPQVERVVERARGLVVLDEAYVDFAGENRADLLRAGARNLLILRTFSKSYALAGMRIGYALGPPEVIQGLDLVKDSYNVDRLAIAAVCSAIQDEDHHRRLVDYVVEARQGLSRQLDQLGFEVVPSRANFVFCRPRARSAQEVYEGLRERRVLVRYYQGRPVDGYLRITVGTQEQHERLLSALQEIL